MNSHTKPGLPWAGLAALVVLAGCVYEPVPAPEVQSELGVHWVQGGETLSAVAARYHVNGGYRRLASLNGLEDPHLLSVGQGIMVPYGGLLPEGLERPGSLPDAVEYEERRSCEALERWPVTELELDGCWSGRCAKHDRDQICLCFDENATLRVGEPARTLPIGTISGPSPIFEVFGGDLDADGIDEIAVSLRLSVSNGIAISHWLHLIFEELESPPLTFRSNWAPSETFIELEHSTGCHVRVGDFTSAIDRRFGPGNYTVVRPYRYEQGELVPSRSDGTVARRLRAGATWTLWPEPPETTSIPAVEERGFVVGARQVDVEDMGRHLELQLELNGHPETLIDRVWRYTARRAEGAFWRLGDRRTGRLYPRGYVPARPETLDGRQMTLRTYGNTPIVWVE